MITSFLSSVVLYKNQEIVYESAPVDPILHNFVLGYMDIASSYCRDELVEISVGKGISIKIEIPGENFLIVGVNCDRGELKRAYSNYLAAEMQRATPEAPEA